MAKNSDPKMLLVKIFGMVVVWGCVAGLSYVFHVAETFDSTGALGMTVVAIILSAFVLDY